MEDEFVGYWKQSLYVLQERAPKPIPVLASTRDLKDKQPKFYGPEFHGSIERTEAEKMLFTVGEGAYLVRESKRNEGGYTLCILFDEKVLNYKLYYDGYHFVGEKRFESVDCLVRDGLISMYVEKHASEYIKNMAEEAIYEQSPYSQYNRSAEMTLKLKLGSTTETKCHNFNQFTFKMPHYCDYCRNFLWGLVQQGVRCLDCGFAAHKKCSEKACNDCHPTSTYVKRMFAVDLTTFCLAHNVRVPPVLLHCIQEVERRGIGVEGIYRVSGSHEKMDCLRRQFDVAQNVDLSQIEDIHIVAGLLKLYLRLLPQQLVPFVVFKSLLKAFNNGINELDRTKSCRKALSELNGCNIYTLQILLGHLRIISENSKENKMSAENLATIFSPTIFCTGSVPSLPQQQHMLLHFLIVNRSVIK